MLKVLLEPKINVASINATGISTFAGSVSISGTLTYDDVTNVDSIGVYSKKVQLDLVSLLVLMVRPQFTMVMDQI